MPNTNLHTAISPLRFNRYLAACGNSRIRALKLYRANLRLSEKMYSVLGVFEVILRNSIDRHFSSTKGTTWLEDAALPDGYLYDSPGCEVSLHSVQEAIHKLGPEYSHDNLICTLTFGFWTYQFSRKEFAASGNTLLEIFPYRPYGTKQKDIFKNLVRINNTRNRIAHHEPVCFDKSVAAISTTGIQKRYDLVIQMLYWMGCTPAKILYGIDGVQKAINHINAINFR
jgi:hypothetical protein